MTPWRLPAPKLRGMTQTLFSRSTSTGMIGPVDPAISIDRIGKVDLLATLLVSAFGVYVMAMLAGGATIDGEIMRASWAAVPLFLLITLPLLLRSQAPLHALGLSIAGLGMHAVLFGELFRCGPVYLVAFFLAYSAGFRLATKDALVGLGMAIVLCMLMAVSGDGAAGLILQPAVLLLWGAGRLVRTRSRVNDELAVRTSALRTARDERAAMEVAIDRARLSTELDELLRRRLAELAQLAESGEAVRSPVLASSTLADIEDRSRRTLEEMRGIVGVLRSEDGLPEVAPAPTLAHLEALLLRATGADARLSVAGDPRVLPPAVELSAYRIVEHLLDALDNAPDVAVEVRFAQDALGLKVSGTSGRRDLGPALERARERVQLHRGTLSTSTRGGRAEAVAQLPVVGAAV
jgi:signal transduction histidine kinase